MRAYNVVIEVTRRCNMACEHCLRGEPQPMNMPEKYLRSFLRNISYISTITFTGGEPSLPSGCAGIERTLDVLNTYDVEVGSFYIATNGKRIGERFIQLIRRLYWRCSDNEVSRVDLSNDDWHHDTPHYMPDKLEPLNWELREDLIGHRTPNDRVRRWTPALLRQGRAKDWGEKDYSGDEIMWRENDWDDDELEISEGAIYLNCKGNVITGCDFSYKSQDDPANILCKAEDFDEVIIRSKGTKEGE